MAVLVEAQGEILDNIETQVCFHFNPHIYTRTIHVFPCLLCSNENVFQVSTAVTNVQSGTVALGKAKMLQKSSRKWMCIAIIILLIIVAIIVVGVIQPWKSGKA